MDSEFWYRVVVSLFAGVAICGGVGLFCAAMVERVVRQIEARLARVIRRQGRKTRARIADRPARPVEIHHPEPEPRGIGFDRTQVEDSRCGSRD